VLSGASTTAMLESNLAALRIAVDQDLLEELAEPADEYWSKRADLPWN
jgi:aryl-alcohol dehydrogenase-like predicted oxidoreductase